MKNFFSYCFVLFFIQLFVNEAFAQNQNEWAIKHNAGGYDAFYGINTYPANDLIVTVGTSQDSTKIDSLYTHANDIAINTYNSVGEPISKVTMGGRGNDYATCIALDNEGFRYIAGSFADTILYKNDTLGYTSDIFNNNIFIAKLDANGNLKWWHTVTGKNNYTTESANAIAFYDNNIYVLGDFSDTVIFKNGTQLVSNGSADVFLAKINPETGNEVWVKQWGSSFYDVGTALVFSPQGKMAIAGYFGSDMVMGNQTLLNNGDLNAFVALINPENAETTWATDLQTNEIAALNAVAFDDNENLYAAGGFVGSITLNNQLYASNGGSDALLLKWNTATLQPEWVKSWGNDQNETFFSLDFQHGTQNLYGVGTFQKSIVLNGNTYLSKSEVSSFLINFDAQSQTITSTKILGATNLTAAKYFNEYVYLAGDFNQSFSFANNTLNAYLNDGLLLRTVNCSTVLATPQAMEVLPFCEGNPLTLTASPVENANLYTWVLTNTQSPNFVSSSEPTLTLATTNYWQAGNYIVFAENNGCFSNPDTVSISIYKNPISVNSLIGSQTVVPADTALYYFPAFEDTTITYVWTITNGTILGKTDTNAISIKWNDTPNQPAEVCLTATTANDCVLQKCLNVNLWYTGIFETSNVVTPNVILVYPNPLLVNVNGEAVIYVNSEKLKNPVFSLTSIEGKQVRCAAELQGTNTWKISIAGNSAINSGIYILNCWSNGDTQIEKAKIVICK